MSNSPVPPPPGRELDEDDLDAIVGGAATGAARKQAMSLIAEDLGGQDHSDDIAKMIVGGAISATEAIAYTKAMGKRDGKHSTDELLGGIRDDLVRARATPAAREFDQEQGRRLKSGEAAAELGRLVNLGHVTGAEAVNVLRNEEKRARSGFLDESMLALEKATRGDDAVEKALGQMIKAKEVDAGLALATVRKAAATGRESVDEALLRLDAAAGGHAVIQAEMRLRVSSGRAAVDMMNSIRNGTSTERDAVATLSAEVAKGVIGQADRARVLQQIETAGLGDVAVETMLGKLVRAGVLSPGAAMAAAKAGAAASRESYDEALGRISSGAGDNAMIELEQRRRSASGATAVDLIRALNRGLLTDGEAVAVLAAKVANGAITEAQQAIDLLKIEKTGLADVAVETALGQLVMAGKLAPAAAIAAVTQGAEAMGESIDVALLRLRAPTCTYETEVFGYNDVRVYSHGDPAIEEAIRNRMDWGATAADLTARLAAGAMTGQQVADLLQSASDAAGVPSQPLGTLLNIIRQRPGVPEIETLFAQICQRRGQNEVLGLVNALTSAETAKLGSVDALLWRLNDVPGPYTGYFSDAVHQRFTDGSMAASLSSTILAGKLTFREAADIISRSGQSMSWYASTEEVGAAKADVLAAVSRSLGRPAEFDAVLADWVNRGEISGDHLLTLDGGPVDAVSLIKMNMNLHGGNSAVEARIADLLCAEALSNTYHADAVDKIVKLGIRYMDDADCVGNDMLAKVLQHVPGMAPDLGLTKLGLLTAAGQIWREPSITQAVQASLLGGGMRELAMSIGNPGVTAQSVIDAASAAVKLVQQYGADLGAPPLLGLIQSSYVLAKLEHVTRELVDNHQTSSAMLIQLGAKLDTDYAMAIAIGKAAAPLVDTLGVENANIALAAGQTLASIADPTTGQEAKTIVELEAAMRAKGVSVDAALALACFTASGRSEVLKLEMTDRLLSGKAQTELAMLAVDRKIEIGEPAAILKAAVNALAAGTTTGTALGYDRDTAAALVTAKLYMQAKVLSETASDDADRGLKYLALDLENTEAKLLLVGCGALLGRLKVQADVFGDPAAFTRFAAVPNSQAAAISADMQRIQSITTELLHKTVVQEVVKGGASAGAEDARNKLQKVTEDSVQQFADAYGKANQLAEFEKDFLKGKKPGANATEAQKKTEREFSASLQTYKFTELGAAIGVSASTTTQLGSGFSVTLSAEAAVSAGVVVDATQVTVKAAAAASAAQTWDLGGHARVIMLAQAIAAGSVTAGVTGVAVKGNVAVGTSVTIEQKEKGSLGNGFDGMQTTTLQMGMVAGAQAGASVGIKNEAAFGAKVGVYASAGGAGEISYGGVTVGGGATIMSPGALGLAVDVGVSFEGGDIKIGVDTFIGAALFGAQFNFNLKLPTGAIVSALRDFGGQLQNVGETIAGGLESFGGDFVDGMKKANPANWNWDPLNWF